MRKRIKWRISAGAVLLFALLYFLDSDGSVPALLLPVLVHEIGHVFALRLCASSIKRVSVSLTGIELDYAPQVFGVQAVLCCLSGPVFGLIYAAAVCNSENHVWNMSGTFSFLLSVFNCLPVLPLDGGRIVAALLPERLSGAISLLCSFFLLISGAVLSVCFHTFPHLLMSAWLVWHNLQLRFHASTD